MGNTEAGERLAVAGDDAQKVDDSAQLFIAGEKKIVQARRGSGGVYIVAVPAISLQVNEISVKLVSPQRGYRPP